MSLCPLKSFNIFGADLLLQKVRATTKGSFFFAVGLIENHSIAPKMYKNTRSPCNVLYPCTSSV
ncbi:hypothetical protein [Helicobacter didelphidarum]|uniref:hypothetical protein n=1 Tax=Helicobacter didelphidarum TaxID=2040648 RepID=UPI0011C03087|nr:hypothetical protein [Helicobacter didelphidarum]